MPYPCQDFGRFVEVLKICRKVVANVPKSVIAYLYYTKNSEIGIFEKFRQIYGKIQNLPKELVNALKLRL